MCNNRRRREWKRSATHLWRASSESARSTMRGEPLSDTSADEELSSESAGVPSSVSESTDVPACVYEMTVETELRTQIVTVECFVLWQQKNGCVRDEIECCHKARSFAKWEYEKCGHVCFELQSILCKCPLTTQLICPDADMPLRN
ncbi:hypothetical protein AVEN_225693-1 [Araneus ventricosus]|uniref:Uncharacterized protein n=1 Tax=Araneus ventricosus TaxID=182803 RepID=A0A4Y2FRM5_ARAVE|nr:hypothetical protein AVEN_225693-1 [Araneus ventricosus]